MKSVLYVVITNEEAYKYMSHYTDEHMKAINRLRFKSGLWKPVVEDGQTEIQGMHYKDRTFVFINDVRKLAGKEPMSREYFEEGWNYRFPYQKNYKYALMDLWLFTWGDW